MRAGLNPFSFLVTSVAGWMNQRQQQVIEYLIEENRILREQIGLRRMRFTDNQRCRLAACAKKLGRKALLHLATIVTPDTLLAWHRRLIAQLRRSEGTTLTDRSCSTASAVDRRRETRFHIAESAIPTGLDREHDRRHSRHFEITRRERGPGFRRASAAWAHRNGRISSSRVKVAA
jgi:hypothetical protein